MTRFTLFALALVACDTAQIDDTDTDTDTDTDPTTVDGPVDLTDAVLTSRSGDCAEFDADYVANVLDLQRELAFAANVGLTSTDTHCEMVSNGIPNHDFNDASARFAEAVAEQSVALSIPRNPALATSPTALSLRTINGVLLNGVVIDLLAAGCWGVGDGKIGCFDMSTPYRYDPMAEEGGFGTDIHHAHTQPGGAYHYHGDPVALWDDTPGDQGSPVIGFAADGFPIFGGYFRDGSTVRRARSGYTLKSGDRTGAPDGPGGAHDGTFVDDWAFTNAGDLDACNGMTVDGQYGYYITETYPWVMGCFAGTPDASFTKTMGGPPR